MRSRFKFGTVALGLLCALLFALCGCGEEASSDPLTFNETVNGIEWTVEYNEETKKINSITARNGMVFGSPETYSPFYLFMRELNGEYCTVIHSITLSGVPSENDMFRITQKDEYSTPGDREDFETVREYFPSCTYSESSYTVQDYNTGESHEETSGRITFCELTTEFEMKIVFTKLPS